MSAEHRQARSAVADRLCLAAFRAAGLSESGVALVAVGGYGRGELAPYSDLDVVLVHDDSVTPGSAVGEVWYPLWDAGMTLDHSVRAFSEMESAAAADLRVALGLLNTRHVAGDPNLTLRLRGAVLTDWRRRARLRLPELRELVAARAARYDELAHAAVPNLKEGPGGLRDAVVLRALVATWLVDVPQVELERTRLALLDVRDHLHEIAGRGTDRITPELWPELAAAVGAQETGGQPDVVTAQREVRGLGRRMMHLSRLTWRRVEGVLARPAGARGVRRPELTPLGRPDTGLAITAGEVVLANPDQINDPTLLLRAATEAAERGAALSPVTAARMVREAPPLGDPWPAGARQLLVRLLAAGRGLLGIWETLEETGALAALLPEWERVLLLPHASTIHRFTVDRHQIETCINASALIREVDRPDVLMVAALLHDLGKASPAQPPGPPPDHCVAGEPVAKVIAARMGFDPAGVELVGWLVRSHLLLPELATSRDPEDPATVAAVIEQVQTVQRLDLLAALTQADALATSPQAWTPWRARLVKTLTARARAVLTATVAERQPTELTAAEIAVPAEVVSGAAPVSFSLVPVSADGSQITVTARDRMGLLADVAATLALQKVSVRAARAWNQGDIGISIWDLADDGLDPAILRQRFAAIIAGTIHVEARLNRPNHDDSLSGATALAPVVDVLPQASADAAVLQVRAADRPGLVYVVLRTLAAVNLRVRSAHIDTIGPQAVDVFYVQESEGSRPSLQRATSAAGAIRDALTGRARGL